MEMGETRGMVWERGRKRGILEDNNNWKVLTSQSPAPEETVSDE
jgi:hypothetical protein